MLSGLRASLRGRLLLSLWGPLLAVLVLDAAGSYALARHIGNTVHDQWLLDSALTLGSQVKGRAGQPVLDLPAPAIEMFEWDRLDRIFEEVVGERGHVLFATAPFPSPGRALVPGRPQFRDDMIDGMPVRVAAIALDKVPGVRGSIRVQVAETLRKRQDIAGRVMWQIAPLQVLVIAAAALVVWFVVTRNVEAVGGIARRLEGYEAHDLAPIADASGAPSEIQPLIHAINELIGKLQESRDAQQRFVANAAHQLRTPLAALQVQAQRALREPDVAKQRDALVDVHRGVTRLHHVAHQLLTLMRSERIPGDAVRMAQVDLAATARDAVEAWVDAALARDIDMGLDSAERPVWINGEAHLLRELFDNLLDNAVRYSNPGTSITLAVRDDPATILVDDEGPGITPSERNLVLERFYRGASRDAHGCGLGLAIAKEITARHGATLALEDGSGGRGLRVRVSFPAPV